MRINPPVLPQLISTIDELRLTNKAIHTPILSVVIRAAGRALEIRDVRQASRDLNEVTRVRTSLSTHPFYTNIIEV